LSIEDVIAVNVLIDFCKLTLFPMGGFFLLLLLLLLDMVLEIGSAVCALYAAWSAAGTDHKEGCIEAFGVDRASWRARVLLKTIYKTNHNSQIT
jgi:hypothetical protein